MNLNLLRLRSSLIAKSISPFDTGNLRHNSMKSIMTPKGFRIIQLGNIAFYGAILNAGPETPRSRVTKIHIGWWDRKVYGAIGKYINDYYNGKQTNLSSTYRAVAKGAIATPARGQQFLRSISR